MYFRFRQYMQYCIVAGRWIEIADITQEHTYITNIPKPKKNISVCAAIEQRIADKVLFQVSGGSGYNICDIF